MSAILARRWIGLIVAIIALDQVTKLYFHSNFRPGERLNAWCWRWLNREHDVRVQIALALIIGGALGNVIDRMWLGKVIDFVLVYWAPWNYYYPAFNVADSAITIGAVLMLWSAFFGSKRAQ